MTKRKTTEQKAKLERRRQFRFLKTHAASYGCVKCKNGYDMGWQWNEASPANPICTDCGHWFDGEDEKSCPTCGSHEWPDGK